MVSVSYDRLSALITALIVMKMSTGSIQRVEVVKCGVFICNYKVNNLSLNSKLESNLYSLTEPQSK
jgi:hypothetical protein